MKLSRRLEKLESVHKPIPTWVWRFGEPRPKDLAQVYARMPVTLTTEEWLQRYRNGGPSDPEFLPNETTEEWEARCSRERESQYRIDYANWYARQSEADREERGLKPPYKDTEFHEQTQ